MVTSTKNRLDNAKIKYRNNMKKIRSTENILEKERRREEEERRKEEGK